MAFVIITLIIVILAILLAGASGLRAGPHDLRESRNANNPDAFEADLDPEGDEPEGY